MGEDRQTPFHLVLQHLEPFSKGLVEWGANAEENELLGMLAPTIEKFAKEQINPSKIDKEKQVPVEVLSQAKELGLFGLTIAECYGGSGLGLKAACGAISKLAFFDSSVSTTVGLHAGLGVRGLNRFGSEALKTRYLGDLASGEKIAAFAATETEAGSHISNVQTRAAFQEADQSLVVNGSKIYVTNGGLADVYTILACTPDLKGHAKGLSLILVPRTAEGVIVGQEEDKLGLRGSSTTTLFFENVKVGADHVIGNPGEGLSHIEEVLAWGRTLMAAGCLGTARRAFHQAVCHARVRKQFGESIANFGLIQEKISLMAQRLYTMESVIRAVGTVEAQGRGVVFESSVAKILCSEGADRVCDESIQIHGGSGYIEETGVARLYRDTRVTRIFEGSNEMLRLHMAFQILSWNVAELERLAFVPAVDGPLAEVGKASARMYGDFVSIWRELKKRYKFGILKNQLAMKALAESALSTYSALAVVARTVGLLKTPVSDDEKRHAVDLTHAIVFEEALKVRRILEEASSERPYAHSRLAEFEYGRV